MSEVNLAIEKAVPEPCKTRKKQNDLRDKTS
jgi:hypothetical protein